MSENVQTQTIEERMAAAVEQQRQEQEVIAERVQEQTARLARKAERELAGLLHEELDEQMFSALAISYGAEDEYFFDDDDEASEKSGALGAYARLRYLGQTWAVAKHKYWDSTSNGPREWMIRKNGANGSWERNARQGQLAKTLLLLIKQTVSEVRCFHAL